MSLTEPQEALNLDLKQQKLLVQYYRSLPEKPTCTVRFFNHGEIYVAHEEDVKMVSQFTGNMIKYMGGEDKFSYVFVKKSQFETIIRELLIIRQYRVEVYVKQSQKINDWSLEYKGSPGNLTQFEEILFENATIDFSNYVMSIKIIKSGQIAVACINVTELQFKVCQFSDNECFTELEALIAQIGPRECIIPQGETQDLINLAKVLQRNSVLVAKIKKSDFNPDVIQDLNRLLFFFDGQQRNANVFKETNLKDAMACLKAAINFLNLTGNEQNFNQFKLSTLDIHRFVRLDNAALYSLNILPNPGTPIDSMLDDGILLQNSTKSFCLIGILNSCVTSQGKRLLEQWIKQPLKDYNLINERLDIVECLVKDATTRKILVKDTLGRLPDLLLLSKKLSSKKCSLQDCYKVYQIVSNVPKLIEVLKEPNNKYIKSMIIDPINEIITDLERYQNMIEEILDLDLVDRGEFLVKHTYDSKLSDIYKRKQKIEEKIQKQLRFAADDLGFDEDKGIKLEYNDQYGYFFRVTLKEEPALRKSKKYTILGAIKGGVRFTNDTLSDLNSSYDTVRKLYEEEQKSVIEEIFEVASGYGDSLRNLNMYIATIDVLASFASVAVSAKKPYVRPRLHKEGSGILKLKNVRHPCIEQQDHINFIPNSCEFDEKTLHIITGPNMCGKSTFIRSIGVAVLMAHIGCLVPCDYAEISLVDAILARVGAEDCQLKGLSTFMLEMIETSTICKTATSNSLVIIDELGRGTSTYDGCGIAYAFAEYLAKDIKCFALFATHFHEITRLATTYSTVNNLHVTALTTNDTITPLYQVKEGHCDNSYGVHCARMTDFPDDVIQWALEIQDKLEHAAGQQLIKDFEPTIKQKTVEEGDEIILETLKKVKDILESSLSKEEKQKEIDRIKEESLQKTENFFIKGLIQAQ